eukprot:4057707-Prymnesium_polylepis.1
MFIFEQYFYKANNFLFLAQLRGPSALRSTSRFRTAVGNHMAMRCPSCEGRVGPGVGMRCAL